MMENAGKKKKVVQLFKQLICLPPASSIEKKGPI